MRDAWRWSRRPFVLLWLAGLVLCLSPTTEAQQYAGASTAQAGAAVPSRASVADRVRDTWASPNSEAATGVREADLSPGPDNRSRSAPEAMPIVTRKMGSLTLHIPKGYLAPMDGYNRGFDYVKIWAKLPCLLPESASNTSEFHKNTLGSILIATLGAGDTGLTGQELLNVRLKDWDTEQSAHEVGKFVAYRDRLISVDIFALERFSDIFFC